MVFALNAATFTTDAHKVAYAMALCKDLAYAWTKPIMDAYLDPNAKKAAAGELKNAKDLSDSWALFSTAFLQQFSAVDEALAAERAIAKLVQKGPIAEHTARFRELAAQTEWNDSAKLAAYRGGLRKDVGEIVSRFPDPPKNLDAYLNWVIKVAEGVENDKGEHPPIGRSDSNNCSRPRANASSRNGNRPTQTRSNNRFNLTREEMARYRSENRCYRCGVVGHMANDPQFHPTSGSRGSTGKSSGNSGAATKTANVIHTQNRFQPLDNIEEEYDEGMNAVHLDRPWEFEDLELYSATLGKGKGRV